MRVYIVMNRYADVGREIEYVAETYEKPMIMSEEIITH